MIRNEIAHYCTPLCTDNMGNVVTMRSSTGPHKCFPPKKSKYLLLTVKRHWEIHWVFRHVEAVHPQRSTPEAVCGNFSVLDSAPPLLSSHHTHRWSFKWLLKLQADGGDVCVCVCVCVIVCYLHLSEDQHEYLTNRMRSFLGSEDILAGPHHVARLFEGYNLVLG